LIQKAFLLQFAAKVVRIIEGFCWASTTNNRLTRSILIGNFFKGAITLDTLCPLQAAVRRHDPR
jgi:hypothetical protein